MNLGQRFAQVSSWTILIIMGNWNVGTHTLCTASMHKPNLINPANQGKREVSTRRLRVKRRVRSGTHGYVIENILIYFEAYLERINKICFFRWIKIVSHDKNIIVISLLELLYSTNKFNTGFSCIERQSLALHRFTTPYWILILVSLSHWGAYNIEFLNSIHKWHYYYPWTVCCA